MLFGGANAALPNPTAHNLPAGDYSGRLAGKDVPQQCAFCVSHDGQGNIWTTNVSSNEAGGLEVIGGTMQNNDLQLVPPQNQPNNYAAAKAGTITLHGHKGVMADGAQLPTFAIALFNGGFVLAGIGADIGGDFFMQ